MQSKKVKEHSFFSTLRFARVINEKHIILGICLVFAGTLFLAGLSLAQTCPNVTTVTGTTVNFVGEITDMGGDSTVTAWFEYGQSTGYGQRSPERILSQMGLYCITVSNLNSCTTYHYRAVAQNSAGTSYGEDKTFTTTCGQITVNKLVRNLSKGTAYFDSVTAEPFDVVSFSIVITASNSALDNVTVKETLPDKIVFRQNSLKVDGVSISGDITSGYNIGTLSVNQARTVAFEADILGADKFVFGDTQLINSVLVYTANVSGSDTAKIVVTKKAVAGATTISTGLTNNIFVDSFVIPLAIALLAIWLLRARIIKFEEWLDNRKNQYQRYKSEKLLQIRVKKIRFLELLKKYSITRS